MTVTNQAQARVLVIDRTRDLSHELEEALAGADQPEIFHLRRTRKALEVVTTEGPWDVIVAGPSENTRAGLRRLADVREHAPESGLLAAVNGTEPADVQALVRAHPDELVRLPLGAAKLAAALRATLASADARRAPEPPPPAPPVPATPERTGRVLVVGGPTGGCGKTTLAINLAALLARDSERRVVLIDVDLQFGEVTAALQLRPTRTLADILFDEDDEPLNAADVAENLPDGLTDTPYGFQVLAAPRDPVQADAITAEQLDRVIDAARAYADEVIIDTPPGLQEPALAALDHADHLVAVTQVDVPGVANLRSYLSTVDELGLGAEHRSVVLNKELADSGVTAEDARQVLGPVAGALPFTPGITRALNAGRPFCEVEPEHPVTRSMRQALGVVLPQSTTPETGLQPRGLRRLWRRAKTQKRS